MFSLWIDRSLRGRAPTTILHEFYPSGEGQDVSKSGLFYFFQIGVTHLEYLKPVAKAS